MCPSLPWHTFVARIKSLNGVEGSLTLQDCLLYKSFQHSRLGALASKRNRRRLAWKVGTNKNLPRLQLVRSVTFSWLGFSSCLTGLSYIQMKEPTWRAPLPSANHVSGPNTAQNAVCRVQNPKCQKYVQVMFTYNQIR